MEQRRRRKQPYALDPGEGWIYRSGVDFTVKAGEMRQGSGAAMVEYTILPGEEPEGHTHNTEDEMFYVLEGSITFTCGDESFDLKKGGFVFLPRGIRHGYKVRGKAPVRVLVVTSPTRRSARGGWGGFVADMEAEPQDLVAKPRE